LSLEVCSLRIGSSYPLTLTRDMVAVAAGWAIHELSTPNKIPPKLIHHPNSTAPARGPCTGLKGGWPRLHRRRSVGVGRSNPQTLVHGSWRGSRAAGWVVHGFNSWCCFRLIADIRIVCSE
ncbi:MAG: hypothetical protein OSB34_12025, partial [Planktomarina sp.]|nr:hypothetical protein [Planktomarina sp.]